MLRFCFTLQETGQEICVPCLTVPWHPGRWWEDRWSRRLLLRVRGAWLALLGPRPNPWISAGVALPREARADILALAAIHALADGLSPQLRGAVQDAVRRHAGARTAVRRAAA